MRRRLTPAVRAAIELAIASDSIPSPLRPVIASSAMEYIGVGERLERTAGGARPPREAPPMPIAGLEAIVQRFGRPPLLVRDDSVVLEDLPDFPRDTDKLIEGVAHTTRSVGRVEFLNHALVWGGTGWVIDATGGRRLVATNRHVAALVAKRKADGGAIFLRSPVGPRYGAAIDFLAEAKRDDETRTASLDMIEYLADDASADVALLVLGAAGFDLPDPINLDETPPKRNDLVAVIGYPAFDSRNDVSDQARYFRDLYEVKRFAPGFVLQPPSGATVFTHDCTTLGGNSGSPIIRLDSGKAIGLHFQGVFGKANSAVTAATLAALLRGERPVSVRLPASFVERPDGHHTAEHFSGRAGFVTGFLGVAKTPWPLLPAAVAGSLAAPSDAPPEPNELRYTHFGVKYCARRKLPIVTAVNVDGSRAVRIKRSDDQWFSDGRIPREVQLGRANFADASIDRGHMVRREDPNWGDEAEAKVANDDTFHYVNAAAQHSILNQSRTLWQGLENYILDSARVHGLKASVFTGPVLRDEDEDEDIVVDGAIVPREFWKLVVTVDAADQALHATAYLLSQGDLIRKLLELRSRREANEGFTLGAYRTFQIAVSDLAAATEYDFSHYVAADPLAKTEAGAEAIAGGEPVFLEIETAADLRL